MDISQLLNATACCLYPGSQEAEPGGRNTRGPTASVNASSYLREGCGMSKGGMGSWERGLYRMDLRLRHFFLSHGESCEACSSGEIGPGFCFGMTPPAAESVGAEERA